jgi:hypothetical protein
MSPRGNESGERGGEEACNHARIVECCAKKGERCRDRKPFDSTVQPA